MRARTHVSTHAAFVVTPSRVSLPFMRRANPRGATKVIGGAEGGARRERKQAYTRIPKDEDVFAKEAVEGNSYVKPVN